MENNQSKVIEIIIPLTLFFITIFSIFIFSKNNEVKKDIFVYDDIKEEKNNEVFIEVEISSKEEIKKIVYDNMTLEELTNKLEKSLKDDLIGYGNLIASYSLEKGVDPYLATAIMLHETGCTWGCSNLVKKCHNVGGMKGTGCGEYGYFNTLEEGIKKFIDNIYKNYYVYGLTTANQMGNKYAEDPGWARKVNGHIEKIKNR